MKKYNNYSAQFKVIQKPENENNNNNNHKQSSFGNNSKKIIKTKPRIYK